MKDLRISESEIPYAELAEFGLSQEMIDDFPESIMDKFLSGQRTPLLPIERSDNDGVIHKDFARIRLVQNDGQVHPVFLPVVAKNDLKEFSDDQKTALRNGQVIKVFSPSHGAMNYAQLDDATNSVLSVEEGIIQQNLTALADKVGFSGEQIADLKDGIVVEVEKDGKMISSGIDLNEETGIRSVDGDIQKWKEEKAGTLKLDKYNFGIYGCWTKDDSGMLSYVPEDKYTQEMVDEQENIVEKAKQGRGFHM